MLGRLNTLLISPTGSGRYLQYVMMWPSICALEGTVYAEFSDSVLVGLSSKRVPVLRFVTLFAAGAYATSWCAGIATL